MTDRPSRAKEAEQAPTPDGPECEDSSETSASGVEQQLDKVLGSRQFSRSERLREFLRYVVQTTLRGDQDALKEQTVALDVFGKKGDFDPRLNPIVRVEARRLRSRLLEYYDQDGKDDPVLIELPRGGYVPRFSNREAASKPAQTAKGDSAEALPLPAGYQAVAVLPFVDMSSEGDNQHFCDGLTEEVITALTRIKGLEVVARSSAFQFQGAAQDVRDVGAKLGVSTVMEGSVRRAEKRVRVTVQLANANNGFHLWSETFDTGAGDVFTVQEEIAQKVVKTLRVQRAERLAHELAGRQSTKSEAYQNYIQGVYHSRQLRDRNLASGVQFFEAAIRLDAEYALAYAGLAKCYCDLAWLGLENPREALSKAKTAAVKALELDEKGAGAAARAALGGAGCIGDWNYQEGRQELLQALDDDPGEYVASQWYALEYLAPMGALADALNVMLRGCEKAGNTLLAQNHVGLIHYYAGDYSEALHWNEAILRENPDFAQAQWDTGRVQLAREEFDEAHRALTRAVEISGGKPLFLGTLGYCEAAMGNTKSAKKRATDLVKLAEKVYVSPLAVAQVYLGLENKKETFKWLRLALEERSCRLIEIDNDPIYDLIRDEKETEKLREAICLTDLDAE